MGETWETWTGRNKQLQSVLCLIKKKRTSTLRHPLARLGEFWRSGMTRSFFSWCCVVLTSLRACGFKRTTLVDSHKSSLPLTLSSLCMWDGELLSSGLAALLSFASCSFWWSWGIIINTLYNILFIHTVYSTPFINPHYMCTISWLMMWSMKSIQTSSLLWVVEDINK